MNSNPLQRIRMSRKLFASVLFSFANPLCRNLRRWLADIRELLFPRCCAICGRRLAACEKSVCTSCFTELPFTEFHGIQGNPVERMFYPDVTVKRANALIFYPPRSEIRLPVLLLKYFGQAEIGILMGRLMATDLEGTQFFAGIDAIVPVPLSACRRRRRGYNQSTRLSLGIAEVTRLPVWTDVLERVVDNDTQTHLSFEQRMGNVDNIFRCRDPRKVRGKHLLLVDDIITTGSTLKSCIKALSAADNVSCNVLTFGITASAGSVPGKTSYDFEP